MIILIKGAGDLATGVAYRLKKCGFDIVMTEIENPTTVRRTVAFSQAVYDKSIEVEGIRAILAGNKEEINTIINDGNIPVIIDKNADIIKELKPKVIVDAIIAKKNLGTKINDAPIVIALGPGFEAGVEGRQFTLIALRAAHDHFLKMVNIILREWDVARQNFVRTDNLPEKFASPGLIQFHKIDADGIDVLSLQPRCEMRQAYISISQKKNAAALIFHQKAVMNHRGNFFLAIMYGVDGGERHSAVLP